MGFSFSTRALIRAFLWSRSPFISMNCSYNAPTSTPFPLLLVASKSKYEAFSINGRDKQVLLLHLLLMLFKHMSLHGVILLPRFHKHLDAGGRSSFQLQVFTSFFAEGSTEPALNRVNISRCSISSGHKKAIGLQPALASH